MRYLFVLVVGFAAALVMWGISYTLLFREAISIGLFYGVLGCVALACLELRMWWLKRRYGDDKSSS